MRMRPRRDLSAFTLLNFAFAALVVTVYIPTVAHAQAKGSSSPAPATPASPSSASFESQTLAYGALNKISEALATKVCSLDGVNKDNGTIVIYDQTAFASLQAYAAFKANAKIVSADYATLIPSEFRPSLAQQLGKALQSQSDYYTFLASREQQADKKKLLQSFSARFAQQAASAQAVPAAAFAPTDPGIDFTNLLSAIAVSSNVETPGQITIPDSNFAVALTRDIKHTCSSQKLSIIYPPLFGTGSASKMEAADIEADIQLVDAIRSQAIAAVEDRNKAFIENYSSTQTTDVDDTQKSPGNPAAKPPVPATKHTHTTIDGANTLSGDAILTAALTDVNGLYDTFMNSLLGINAATGTSGSTAAIQGELLAEVLCGEETESQQPCEGLKNLGAHSAAAGADPYAGWVRRPAFIVLASVANAGGTELDHKTFWTALSSGDKITYSGGVIVNVAVWKADSDRPVYASVLRYRVPFSDIEDPGDAADAKAGKSNP